MRLFPLLLLVLSSNLLHAQCTDYTLAEFQVTTKADDSGKEALILQSGFDLHKEIVVKGITYRRYDKCWRGFAGDVPIYEQVFLWNQTNTTLIFATLDEEDYKAFRSSIETRASSATAGRASDIYVGRMFTYRFSQQEIDGESYYAIAITMQPQPKYGEN